MKTLGQFLKGLGSQKEKMRPARKRRRAQLKDSKERQKFGGREPWLF